jgi:hypothetical protein
MRASDRCALLMNLRSSTIMEGEGFCAAPFHDQAGYRAEALVSAALERVQAEREASRPEAP